MPGSATPSTVGLVVGSNLSLAGGQLDNTNSGDAWVGGSVSSSANFNFEQHLNYVTSFNPANIETGYTPAQISSSLMPINFSSAATTLTQLSDTLGTLAVNGTVTTSGSNLTFTATGCTVCVFDLPAADMPGGAISNSAISINAPTGATVIVNVPGTADSISNSSITYTGGATASDTIFNFDAAKSLTTSGATVNGSILAPFATFTGTNGSVDGELIAGSVTNESAELESAYIFSGNLGSVATPEPSTWILMAGALFVCALLRTKRTTSAAN